MLLSTSLEYAVCMHRIHVTVNVLANKRCVPLEMQDFFFAKLCMTIRSAISEHMNYSRKAVPNWCALKDR